MADGRLDVEPLPFRLLAGNDQINVVAATQTMVGDREQTVGVRRKINPDDAGFLVREMIDETRILVGEAVVILAPDVRSRQVVQ